MRVRDLVTDKDALITRDYWLKRAQLGQPMLTYIPTCLPLTAFGVPSLRYGIPVGEEGESPNWRYSATRNPNLIGMPFGSDDGSSNTPNDGTHPITNGGLDCVKIPASSTAASGVNGAPGNAAKHGTADGQNTAAATRMSSASA